MSAQKITNGRGAATTVRRCTSEDYGTRPCKSSAIMRGEWANPPGSAGWIFYVCREHAASILLDINHFGSPGDKYTFEVLP